MRLNLMSLLIVLIFCSGCSGEYGPAKKIFKDTFQKSPGKEIKNLRAYGWKYLDSTYCYLEFDLSIDKLKSYLGNNYHQFNNLNKKDFKNKLRSTMGKPPTWWQPVSGSQSDYYFSSVYHPDFSKGDAIFSYSKQDKKVYFYWRGVD